MRKGSSCGRHAIWAVKRVVDIGDITKKGKKLADKAKEATHKAEHRVEEAGEKAKDTVRRQV